MKNKAIVSPISSHHASENANGSISFRVVQTEKFKEILQMHLSYSSSAHLYVTEHCLLHMIQEEHRCLFLNTKVDYLSYC